MRSFVWHAGHGWPSFFVTSAHACDETMVSFTQNGFFHANKVFRRLNTWGSVFGEDILQNPHIQHPTHPDGIKFRLRFRVPYSVFQSIARLPLPWRMESFWRLVSAFEASVGLNQTHVSFDGVERFQLQRKWIASAWVRCCASVESLIRAKTTFFYFSDFSRLLGFRV